MGAWSKQPPWPFRPASWSHYFVHSIADHADAALKGMAVHCVVGGFQWTIGDSCRGCDNLQWTSNPFPCPPRQTHISAPGIANKGSMQSLAKLLHGHRRKQRLQQLLITCDKDERDGV